MTNTTKRAGTSGDIPRGAGTPRDITKMLRPGHMGAVYQASTERHSPSARVPRDARG